MTEDELEAQDSAPVAFEPMPKLYRLFRDIVISEKIDGTNAALYIDEITGELRIASRKRFIIPGDDNFAFAKWATDNASALKELLGPGIHRGEWWGAGIQRGYGMKRKYFSLFNTGRWALDDVTHIPGLSVVPQLYAGPYSDRIIQDTLQELEKSGSWAAIGYMKPEGVVVFHVQSNSSWKVTLGGDGHKGFPSPPTRNEILQALNLDLQDAVEIVLDLARGNQLEDDEASQDPEILVPMQVKQERAIDTVHEYFRGMRI